jgi:hypothetical protein
MVGRRRWRIIRCVRARITVSYLAQEDPVVTETEQDKGIADKQVGRLKWMAAVVVSWLVVVVLACLAASAALLAYWSPGPERLQNVLLCVLGGTMGSGISGFGGRADLEWMGVALGREVAGGRAEG